MTLHKLVERQLDKFDLTPYTFLKANPEKTSTYHLINRIMARRGMKITTRSAQRLTDDLKIPFAQLTKYIGRVPTKAKKRHRNVKVSKLMKARWARLKEAEKNGHGRENGHDRPGYAILDLSTGQIVERF